MWSIYVMCLFLASDSKKSGVPFIEKTNTSKTPCFVDSKLKNHCFSPIQPTHRGWHNITNTRCPKSRLYNFNALELDAVYSSIYGNYRPGSKLPEFLNEAVQSFQGVFFCLGGTRKGVVWGGRVVSGGLPFLFFAFGWLMRWWCDGLSKLLGLLLSSSPNMGFLSNRSFEF